MKQFNIEYIFTKGEKIDTEATTVKTRHDLFKIKGAKLLEAHLSKINKYDKVFITFVN